MDSVAPTSTARTPRPTDRQHPPQEANRQRSDQEAPAKVKVAPGQSLAEVEVDPVQGLIEVKVENAARSSRRRQLIVARPTNQPPPTLGPGSPNPAQCPFRGKM
jgi:cytochrome c-type biogenesis protein CcmH/NrfG